MKKLRSKKKALTTALTLCLVLSLGSTTFASSNSKPNEVLSERLDSLVKSSIISKQQKDSVISYMEQRKAEKKAKMDKVKNMTEEERKQYFSQNTKSKTDPLKDIVA